MATRVTGWTPRGSVNVSAGGSTTRVTGWTPRGSVNVSAVGSTTRVTGWTRGLLVGLLLACGGTAPAAPAAEPMPTVAARAAYASAAALQNRSAWALAAQEWQALIEAHPRDVLAPKARYQLGICRLKLGDWPAAAASFRAVATAGGADAETLALARFELARGTLVQAQATGRAADYGAAASLFRDVITAGPPPGMDADATSYLGEAQWQAGDRDAALATWRAFAAATPDARAGDTPRLADVLYAQGVAEAELGRKPEATATLGRFARLFPDHRLAPDVTLWRADLLLADDPAAAERLVAPLAKAGPKVDAALDRIGAARWKRGDWKGAAEAYGRLADAHTDSPLAPRAALSAGLALAEAGDPAAARRRLAPIVDAREATAAPAARRLARLDIESGEPARALTVAERGLAVAKAIGADPALVSQLELVRADALWELPDRREDAVAAYAALLRSHPDDPVAAPCQAMLALAALEGGRAAEARALAEAFLARQPAAGVEPGGDSTGMRADVAAIRAEALLAGGDAAAAAAAYGELIAASDAGGRVPRWLGRQAVALAAAEQWQGARELIGRAVPLLRKDPADVEPLGEALLIEATALVELGQPREALAVLATLERTLPRWSRSAERDLLAIRARQDGGDPAGALEAAERLAAGDLPEAFRELASFRLGQARQAAGRDEAAVAAYGDCVRRAPDGPRAAASLAATGWCEERRGRRPEAIAAWTTVIDRFPDSPACTSALLGRADARQRAGDPAGALADAELILARHDAGTSPLPARSLAEARLLTGICLAGVGRPADAVKAFDRILAESSDYAGADRVCWERGLAALATGDPAARASASESFERLIDRHPRSPRVADAWLELGELAFDEERYDDATAAYAAAIGAAGPDGGGLVEQARHKLGWVHAIRGDHPAAVEAFAAQVAAAPAGPWAADGQALLGQALFATGRIAEARQALDAALADPTRLSSDGLRGAALLCASEVAAREDRWEESLACAERCVALLPGGAEAGTGTAAQARYAAAWARQNLGQLDAALAGFRGLADATTTPLAARARLMEGEVLFEQGRHEDAIRTFFKVAYATGDGPEYRPWQAQAIYEAARCFEVLRQTDQARGLYAELVAKHPESPQVGAARKRLAALGAPPRSTPSTGPGPSTGAGPSTGPGNRSR
jgi:TolA-binding protein